MDHDTQPIYQTRVKICGLTNLDDALVATEAGADLLGFIFYEKSPRNVTPRQVRDIIDQLGVAGNRLPSTVHRSPLLVGVFVNPSLEQVTRTLDYCGLDLAQLHGEEAPELLAALPGRAFKALRPKDAAEAASQAGQFARFGPAGGPDLLVDAYHPTLRGGGGQTGDWSLAAGLAAQHRLLLAGGLTPDNVAAAIAQVQPWGVDVASGVEATPGRKDHNRVRAFLAACAGER
ncbi:MAG TPA: phosphoribosylanthranilate isomerase [Anaerolineae bacterium]|nr:phosphoribosylanthranilate isomerase [Anaerolineae bacterium]HNU05203.1 phosphoribosylanthranilate isomerase [Anaerolineae bacterium]